MGQGCVYAPTLGFAPVHTSIKGVQFCALFREYMGQACICAPTLGFALAHTSMEALDYAELIDRGTNWPRD